MPLDSDVTNGDALLDVVFYVREAEPDKGKTYVRIKTPGNPLNIIDQPAADHYKVRFQDRWLRFQASSGNAELIGTPILQWHTERPVECTDGHMMNLQILNFQTVEQVAQASDAQLQRIMGGPGLRDRARMYLAGKNAAAGSAELDAMKAELAEMRALLANKSSAPAPKRRGPKPGFKRKARVNADNNASTDAAGRE